MIATIIQQQTSMKLIAHTLEIIHRKVEKLIKVFALDKLVPEVGRKPLLSQLTSVSLGLFKQKHGIPTKKQVHEMFPFLCSYKTLVVSMNRWSLVTALILSFLLKLNRISQHVVKHIDSSCIPVCLFRNAKRHKVMRGIADYGKTSQGTFFGLKLHLISDLLGKLQSVMFTPGNVSDKDTNIVLKLARDIWGVLIGDAGYVSKKLADAFNEEPFRILLVKPYKNMKKLATRLQGLLYGTRMMVERHFQNLKLTYGLITSFPRSITGYFANYFSSILAYMIA